MGLHEITERLLHLTKKATSPFHTVQFVEEELLAHGFEKLSMKECWELKRGGRYLVEAYGTSVFAFTIGAQMEAADGFRIGAAHGDVPGFRIKPNPELATDGYLQLNVEAYGGVNLASWLDRELSIAGRVMLKSEDAFHPESRLVDFQKPLLMIPNIAIHLNRELNKGQELNKQTQMLPIVGMGDGDAHAFLEALATELGVAREDILDYELYLYNIEEGCRVGLSEEFVMAPRLDDLTSVLALVDAMIAGERARGLNMIAIFDHEEVGSRTKQGAGSVLLSMLLEKIYMSLGVKRQEYLCAFEESFLMSVDVSHGFHPAYAGKYDPSNKNRLNNGFSIKEACSQSYATDSAAVSVVQQICEQEHIAYQKYVNRSDIAGGGTLGAIASALLPVKTVDIGVPLLSMHSAKETMGVKDQESLQAYLTAFFRL